MSDENASSRRLLHVGSAIVDIAMCVPFLPASGGDVLATSGQITPGGGFNVMSAARRVGMAVGYGGAHGTGHFGDMIRGALADAGVAVLHEPSPDEDSGFCVALTDDDGERTFLTHIGAEANLSYEALATLDVAETDIVYVSGYGLVSPVSGPALVRWLAMLPATTTVVADPAPLVGDIPPHLLEAVLRRADWWTCNLPEALRLTGANSAREAGRALLSMTGRAGVLVRMGKDGCLLLPAGLPVQHLPGYRVEAVDTNGAGDTHVGVFLAALATGRSPALAADRANAAAALSTTLRGPATGPSSAELEAFLSTRH